MKRSGNPPPWVVPAPQKFALQRSVQDLYWYNTAAWLTDTHGWQGRQGKLQSSFLRTTACRTRGLHHVDLQDCKRRTMVGQRMSLQLSKPQGDFTVVIVTCLLGSTTCLGGHTSGRAHGRRSGTSKGTVRDSLAGPHGSVGGTRPS